MTQKTDTASLLPPSAGRGVDLQDPSEGHQNQEDALVVEEQQTYNSCNSLRFLLGDE